MAYTREDIHRQLCEMMQELFEIEAECLTPDADLVHDLDIDSIDMVDLLIALKNKTGKKVSPEAFQQVRTVADLIDTLEPFLAE